METTARERISRVLTYTNLNAKQLASRLGLSFSGIYHVANGVNNSISSRLAALIVLNYPEISYGWLVDGEGEMIIGKNPDFDNSIRGRLNKVAEYANIPIVELIKRTGLKESVFNSIFTQNRISEDIASNICLSIPAINIDWLTTGRGDMLNENADKDTLGINNIAFVNSYEKELIFSRLEGYSIPDFIGADFLTRIRGKAMEPVYHHGDIIACKLIPDILYIEYGLNYLILTKQGGMIRKLMPGDNCYIARSTNSTSFPDIPLQKDVIEKLAKVIGVIRLE